MAKRFSDSEKWKKPFLRAMKAPYKLLWLYILDECDHAGIWQVDFEVAQIKIGEKLNYEKAVEQLNGKIHVFADGEKWFIPDFVDFQYGVLNEKNRVHESVINILSKNNLIEILQKNKPLTSPLQGAKDKDKDKEEDKDKEKEKEPREEIFLPFESEIFARAWSGWKEYKKTAHNFNYKGLHSEQIALKRLSELSNNNENIALQIIEQSIGNGWEGLFEIKNKTNGHTKESIIRESNRQAAEIIERGNPYARKES